jgi:hypothetical protein
MGKRAAVVVGVDKTGNLTPLKSAAAGAKRIGDWLKREGFEVELLTDETDPVRARDIEDAINRFVKPPTRYELLFVYFSGHGYWQNRSDQWMLSEAPQRPNEAINLKGAIDLAKICGIPNVVFVSDACRSLPQDLASAFINGSDGFPVYDEFTEPSKVDVFRATSAARPAYEVSVGAVSQSVLTVALESAYVDPPAEIVAELDADGTRIKIVPNRKLEDFLQDKIDDILAGVDINLVQVIEADVPSDDNVYIARVRSTGGLAGVESIGPGPTGDPSDDFVGAAPPRAPSPSFRRPGDARGRNMNLPGNVAAEALRETLKPVAGKESVLRSTAVPAAVRNALVSEISANMPGGPVVHFESQTGFSISGAHVARAICSSQSGFGGNAEVLNMASGPDSPAVVRIWTEGPGTSALIQFADSRAILLPALFGYIGHCTMTEEGLANVSYVPSDNTSRWHDYALRRERIDLLRAKVAVAANHGRFSLSSSADAERLADQIRVEKAIDPTLGLYAAYAYSQAGKDARIKSVLEYMRMDLTADLFDVRMLAFRAPPPPESYGFSFPVLPACPLLTQGWNLVRSRRIVLAPVLAEAAAHLTGSLWTTFTAALAGDLFAAIERGDL